MQVTKVTRSMGIVTNTGNYENVRYDAAVEAQVEDGASAEAALKEVDFLVRTQLWEAIQPTIVQFGQYGVNKFARQIGITLEYDDQSPQEPSDDEGAPF